MAAKLVKSFTATDRQVAVNVVKAISDPNLFRSYVTGSESGDLSSWRNWLACLRVLYGLKPPADDHEIVRQCTGRDPSTLPRSGFRECLLLCGRRSGKSKMIALVGAAEAVLSGKEKKVSKGEIPMVAIISPTRFQSRIIHSYLKGVFDSTPMLQAEVVEQKKESFVLKNGVEVSIITGDPKSVRGFSVIAAIVDEIAMFGLSEESKVRSDTELIRAIRPSLASTGGRLLAVGTPYAPRGYAYDTFKKNYGNETKVLVWNAPSTVMNPTLSPEVIEAAIAEDPIAANVEYCTGTGLFREDVEEFVGRAIVEALVIKGRKELPPGREFYAAFADVSGGRHDDACLAIGHLVGTTIVVIDCLQRFKAPHDPHDVVRKMCETIQRYGIKKCMGDAYAAEWTRTTFAQNGILYNRAGTTVWKDGASAIQKIAKPKSQLYVELLPRLTSGQIELLDNDVLVNQLASLQRRTRSGGRDSIDHPPGGKDDLANVVAGVCDAIFQRIFTAGSGGDFGFAGTMGLAEMNSKVMNRSQDRLAREQQISDERFNQMMNRPDYLDNPLYKAMKRMGSDRVQ